MGERGSVYTVAARDAFASASARGLVTKVLQMPADTDLTANMQFEPGVRLSGHVTLGGKPLAVRPTRSPPPGARS